jgi:hypothetical protein
VRKRQGFGGLSASQATSAVAPICIHPRVNPWSSAKADKKEHGVLINPTPFKANKEESRKMRG